MERNILTGQNIICFGSENWAYTGFQQTVMRLLAHDNRILYFNALGIRRVTPRISEIPRYLKRAKRLFQRNIEESASVMVCNARIIPLVYNDLINKINRILVRKQFLALISRMNIENYILWIGTPTAPFLLDLFNPVLSVYNPVDRYYAFPFVDAEKIRDYERKIAEKVDVIICTSDAIREDLSRYKENCFTVTHGVDFDHFNSAFGVENVPDDIRGIPKPIIGFFGGLSERVNFRLIYEVGIRYPDAKIVLIGEKSASLGKIEKLKNVYILGFKDFRELPLYLKHFSVCLIPYHVNELMEGVDPIKLREYLSLGKPVVSVDLPEVRKFEGLVYIGKNQSDFVDKVGKAMEEDNPSFIERRMREAKRSDWNRKIKDICKIINDSIRRNGES